LKGHAGKIGLQRGTVIFEQGETDMGLDDGRNQALVLAFGFVHGFIGLGNIFFEGDGVAKFAFALALQFLETGKIGLRRRETSGRSSEFDGKVFTGFGDSFDAAESFEVGERSVEIVGRHGNRGSKSATAA